MERLEKWRSRKILRGAKGVKPRPRQAPMKPVLVEKGRGLNRIVFGFVFFTTFPLTRRFAIRSSDKKVYSAAFLGILRAEEDPEASLQSIRTVQYYTPHTGYLRFKLHSETATPKAFPSLHRSIVRPFNLPSSFSQHTDKRHKRDTRHGKAPSLGKPHLRFTELAHHSQSRCQYFLSSCRAAKKKGKEEKGKQNDGLYIQLPQGARHLRSLHHKPLYHLALTSQPTIIPHHPISCDKRNTMKHVIHFKPAVRWRSLGTSTFREMSDIS